MPAWVFETLEKRTSSDETNGEETTASRLERAMQRIIKDEGDKEITALREFWGGQQRGVLIDREQENENS